MVKVQARKFSGEDDNFGTSEDPGKWLEHFEMTCLPNNWEDDDDKIVNFPAYLTGEAEDWYVTHRDWVHADARTWDQIKNLFTLRFRPVDYEAEVEERLRTPTQKIGESVRGYGGRYERLHMQAGPDAPTLVQCRRYWIAGLNEEIKIDVMMHNPATFLDAVERAMLREIVVNTIARDKRKTEEGKRPRPEAKNQSTDAKPAEDIVNDLAGLGRNKAVPKGKGKEADDMAPEDDPRFPTFFEAMSPEIEVHDPTVDELVDKFKAWKLLSRVYHDPAVVKAKVLKSMAKKEPNKAWTDNGPICFTCKEVGHMTKNCPKKPTFRCYVCGEEGHGARSCPKAAEAPTAEQKEEKKKVSTKKATAKKVEKAKKSKKKRNDSSDDEDEIITSYMARLKRKTLDAMDEDPAKKPEKVKKMTKRNVARKLLDPEVVNLFRKMPVPLELIAKHGASFESQAKRAMKEVYDEGRSHRKKVNPLRVPSQLSHALTIAGVFAKKVNCERLVIDPGCSVSMLDVNLARKAKIGIKRKSKLIMQLADGGHTTPIGQTAEKELVDVQGVKVALRMPVVDSKNTYDILLGRDWLHQTKAVGTYDENAYVIQAGGKTVRLEGQRYTKAEVVLSDSSSEGSSTDESTETSDSSEEESSDEDDEEEGNSEIIQTYRARCVRLEQFDVRPRLSSTRVLKVKKEHPDATLPMRATGESAGYDLFASRETTILAGGQDLVSTGISIEIPEGYYGQVKPRSGLALKKGVTTDAGVIDRDYRGEVGVILVNRGKKEFTAKKGERVAQLVLIKNATPEVQQVNELNETARGTGGFGSTGLGEIARMQLLQLEQLKEVDINPDLNEDQRKQVEDLLWEYRDSFANTLAEMGHSNVIEHEINLKPGVKPFYCPGTRRFAPAELESIRENIKEELETGKIIEFDGPWCAPIVIAKKKDGSFRKCVAYNGLNDRTERESWPLPNIEELLEKLAGHKWYSACDGYMGYYSVKIRDEDVAKTMFKTPFGTFAYTVMPFGLKNAPHTYSRVTAKTFAELLGKTVEAYIDDTATYSNTFEEHLVHMRATFDAAKKTGIRLKASKCHFFYPEIEFVGHLVGMTGIRMMPEKIERVQQWPVPTDRTKLKGFLGLAGYYRRLIKDFANIAVPLNKLTSKKVPFEWKPEQQKAFEELKKAMTTAPVLGKPNYEKEWVLEVDASDVALGAVLGQEQDDLEVHPVYFWSRQLNHAERNYSVTDRECLAVVAACGKFRPYILGGKVVIYGDHTAVKWILNKVEISGRHARWKVKLSEFDYKMFSRPGAQNGNADALSRLEGGEEKSEIDDEPNHLAYRTEFLRTQWVDDPWYKDVYLWLEVSTIQKESAHERERVRKMAGRYAIKGNKLYYRDSDGGLKLCLGRKDIKDVLREFHDGTIGGHFGRDITVGRIRQMFWWPTIWRDVAEHVRTCDTCQRYGPKENHNALRPYQPVYPFEFIFLDFVISLPITAKKNKHVITMTEGLTKWVEAKPVRDASAKTAANFLMNDIIHRFGAPLTVITDNGSHFRGEFHELCEKMNIQHRFGTAYHPQTTGQDERTNGLLLGRIRKWRLEEYNRWDEDMPASVLACNTRKISTTGFSAMESLMGFTAGTASSLKHNGMTKKEVRKRVELVVGGIPNQITGMRLRVLETLRDESIRIKSLKNQQMKERYDKNVHEREFKIGDEILLYNSGLLKQWSRKLEERWLGPYKISWKGTLGAYAIKIDGKSKQVSGDQLKFYHRRG